MLLVDVHAHLDHRKFSQDLDLVVDRARRAKVEAVVAQGCNHESNLRVLGIARKYPDIVKAALGLYPIDAKNIRIKNEFVGSFQRKTSANVDETLDFIREMKDQVFAVGEVGIDLKYSGDLKTQQQNFEKVIQVAKLIQKPVSVHARQAELDTVEQLISSGFKKVYLHSFMGKRSVMKKAADAGFYFSVPTSVVRNEQLQLLADIVDIDQLLTETDSPFLAHVPRQRNEPANVCQVVRKIAEIKKLDVEETANAIFENYQRLFL
jgi:TatD DNase family protein